MINSGVENCYIAFFADLMTLIQSGMKYQSFNIVLGIIQKELNVLENVLLKGQMYF